MKLLIHYLYWFLIFNIGSFELLGFGTAIHKIGIPALCMIIFVYTIINKKNNIQAPMFKWIFLFVLVTLLGAILNEIKFLTALSFLFFTVIPYLYFLVILNENKIDDINRITKWILFLIILQIPAIIFKYFTLGQTEKGAIGTLHTGMGSLSTVFPVLIIAFLIGFYLFSNKLKYIFWIFLFIGFGIVGDKRAIAFWIPFEFILGYLIFLVWFNDKIDMAKIKKLVAIVLIGFVGFYFIVRTNATLNKEKSNWGSFDIDYVINYSDNYTSSYGKGKAEMRRKDGLIYFLNYNLESDVFHMLLGDGPGRLIRSNYDKDTGTMLELYGVRYGGRMGVIWILLQVGVIGTLVYFIFLFGLYKFILKESKFENNYLLLGFILASVFMLIDVLSYSRIFMATEIVKNLYFFTGALLLIGARVQISSKQKLLLFNTTL